MTRTLIALLATAAIALPAAAQQTNSQQGSMQYNRSAGQQATAGKTGSAGEANANAPRAKYGNRNYGRGHMAANVSKGHIRGRTSYREYGRRGYGVRAGGVYGIGGDCWHWVNGHRVWRCLGGPGYAYLHGRRYYGAGRYAYLHGPSGVGAYGGIRGGQYAEHGRTRFSYRQGKTPGTLGGTKSQRLSRNQGKHPAQTARNLSGTQKQPGTQTQTGSQQGKSY